MKNEDVFTLVNVLNQLDPPQGKSNWAFSAKTRWNLGKNLRRLSAALREIEEHRQKMIGDFGLTVVEGKDGKARLEGEKLREYERAFRSVLQEPSDVQLHQIDEGDLDLDKNQIPMTLLEPLIGTLIRETA
jgi:hypothetical protein